MTTILDGRLVSDSLLNRVKEDVKGLGQLKLVVVVVGNDPASEVYVKHKEKACERVGIQFEKIWFEESTSQEVLLDKIRELNEDDSVTGMIVQFPVPAHMDEPKIVKAIDPYKDADGFHAYNVGKMVLSTEFEDLVPATPKGIVEILNYYKVDVSGMNVVVIGRSNIVGKPIANMLLNRGATVTVCHRRTKDVKAFTQMADLIVVAAGKVNLLNADMVKEGAIVIDVGINRLEDGKIVGDADFEGLKDKVSMITPVPGGVGPMTVACLLSNLVTAAKKQVKI